MRLFRLEHGDELLILASGQLVGCEENVDLLLKTVGLAALDHALQSAIQIGVSPVPFLFAVTVAASMCFASPFSTPPNALVMPAGQYTFMDYIKVGLPLQIIMGVVMVFVLPLLFPF